MWLSRLPPDYRRRYYTNMAILIGLIALVLNWSFPGLVDTQLSPSKAGEGVFSAKIETEIR